MTTKMRTRTKTRTRMRTRMRMRTRTRTDNSCVPKIIKRNVELKALVEKPQIDNNIINYFKDIRGEFPFYQKKKDCPVYFDSAATTHKPSCVIRKIEHFYSSENSNIHRGIYKLSREATNSYEHVRKIVKDYINCDSAQEIVFTNGATYGLNLVCNMLMDKVIMEIEDEIYISYLEHHSNIIPWQEEIKKRKKGKLKYIPLKTSGYVNIKKMEKIVSSKMKVVSISHVSNVLGNIQNVSRLIKKIKKKNPNIIVIIDASQSFAHLKYDIKKMIQNKCNPDILIASGHKFCASLGSGFIYIKKSLTCSYKFKPLLYGSNIITQVKKYKSKFVSSPQLFETGTQNIAAILSMGVSLLFLKKIQKNYSYIYEMYLYDLLIYYLNKFLKDKLIQLPWTVQSSLNCNHNTDYTNHSIGKPHDHHVKEQVEKNSNPSSLDFKIYIHNSRKVRRKKIGILPLWSDSFSSFDLVTFLDFKNICIRSGHHCASLLHHYFLKIPESSRISIFFYNTPEEVHYLAEQIAAVALMLNELKR
ncbi:cysteine desulfurase, putative [Plasmodium malariae]|uniref:Cysteine desulfurase, putative n=1 Tax=Plasmodium malariae TaxID=5858 RepID=A0A1D3JIF2_PLAMA|nr:cysteine desulfurase, putative [Plasmodium malariae]SBT86275.1 cysteine desulfurase, putative [Plasmodium malariae]